MLRKVKDYLNAHEKQYELLRYLIAGGLTTLLSMLIHYAGCFLMAQRPPYTGDPVAWIRDSINSATPVQLSIASTVSWVIAVLFAFWINRGMVFRVEGAHGRLKELIQFASSRFVSFLVFEQGLMLLLEAMGIENLENRVIVLVFVMVFNYVVSKFWIFKKNGETKPRA